MKLEITNKIDNPLMSRTKILFEAQHDEGEPTPSRKQIRDVLAAKAGADKELLVISSINTQMGTNSSSGVAYLYKDKKALDRLAFKYLKKRDAREPKAKKAPAEEVKEEKAEESKEKEEAEKAEVKEEK